MSASGESRIAVDRVSEPLLSVRDLEKRFPVRGRAFGPPGGHVDAVNGVSFDVWRGETLSLVGESGCGKTTTARSILRLIEPTAGEIRFDGQDVRSLDREGLRRLRKRVQLVFQDPYGSLNPRMRAGAMLAEALKVHGLGGSDRRGRVVELLARVGLGAVCAELYPHELSGGQRQRLAIARALSVEPDFLVLDEPVSALDVSVQAQVINLLDDLQQELRLTYLFIAHDLALVEHVSDRVAVMYLGRIVETAGVEDLWAEPRHPYTRALLSATLHPGSEGGRSRARIVLPGEASSSAGSGTGCPFRPRCPHPLKDVSCAEVVPLLESKAPGHFAACLKRPLRASDGG